MINYEKYIAPIFRFIYFKIKNYQEAEDLTQTVFLKAWKNIDKYKDEGYRFSSWLYAIARNTVIDYWKKNKALNIEEEILNLIPDNKNILEEIENESDFKQIINSINELSEEQEEIIILKFIEGLSNQEISKITNKKEDAIRQLQTRALKSLKDILEKYE